MSFGRTLCSIELSMALLSSADVHNKTNQANLMLRNLTANRAVACNHLGHRPRQQPPRAQHPAVRVQHRHLLLGRGPCHYLTQVVSMQFCGGHTQRRSCRELIRVEAGVQGTLEMSSS